MKLILTIFLIGTLYSFAQTNVLDQDYYFVVKEKTIQFKQKKDSLFITNCSEIGKCDSLPKFSYLILRDSLVNDTTKVVFVKGQKYKHRNLEVHEKEITFISYENGRKAIKETYIKRKKEKTQFPILYPTSELALLKPISEISVAESKEIILEFKKYITSLDKNELDIDDYKIWEKFNDLVIQKGYTPIDAEREVGLKFQK
ncbi:hypothetical protein IMCC3317_20060 [Kordia antarctica]|uniref:DUF4369 domain-containing protein n=1 Tax=Kordia antarctica TaxID=1218801 RepID=A0A7L4ZIV4_9FLAO|nr:hypothetical protein [Kordia antarctica]QHI36643.1 hypothetical protein IMCC3317_20060 [Kordia antarctica]